MSDFRRRVFSKQRDRRPPSSEETVANGIVRAVFLLAAVGFLIYLAMHYF